MAVDVTGQVFAIAGCTNAGKTTIANMMKSMLLEAGFTVEIIHQDDYFYECDQVKKIYRDASFGPAFYYDYDAVEAIDSAKLVTSIKEARKRVDYVILEGNMITEWTEVLELCSRVIFLTLNKASCLRRRLQRSYDPPDEEGYFDEIVWPAYQVHLRSALTNARLDRKISFYDVSSEFDTPDDEIIMTLIQSFFGDIMRITSEPIDVGEATSLVNSPSCGATSAFIGTTRDTFEGRRVIRLDYESYDEMAYKELQKLCSLARDKYPSLEKVLIIHRVGEVPIGEASVVIATASPHRQEALHATEMLIDELKRTVPIWKKEVYDDGGCSWKENKEALNGIDIQNRRCCTGEKKSIQTDRKPSKEERSAWLQQVLGQFKRHYS